VKRRDLIAFLASTAALRPLATVAQQTAMPVIGYLSSRSPSDSQDIIAAFHQGLDEAGFVDKHNVLIEYRFAEGNFDRLPGLAAELVGRQVNVLVATGGTVSAVKAKLVLPTTIPMVFAMGGDPVELGIVESLNRPGGNITGVTFLVSGLAVKALEILNDLLPKATTIGFLFNPENPNSESSMKEAEEAANKLGKKLIAAEASTEHEIDSAFTTLEQQQAAALLVQPDSLFTDQRVKIVVLAARQALPAVYTLRDFAVAGGLVAYGTSITDANRHLGSQTGRVLKGDKPADLPVMQSTRFELIINLKTAKALGLEIPPILLVRADEVIE
jgi:putative tryptophan/tyrosine transport system substrate-binding protein